MTFEFPWRETDRVIVRRFLPADLAPFMGYRNDPLVNRFDGCEAIGEDAARAYIAEQIVREAGLPGKWLQIAFARKNTGELIGDCGLRIDADEPRQAEVGYRLAREYQGQGLASEAVRAVLDYVFEEAGLHRVVALVDCENGPSIALLERLRFRREGRTLQSYWDEDRWADEYLYAMLGEEWQFRKDEPDLVSARDLSPSSGRASVVHTQGP